MIGLLASAAVMCLPSQQVYDSLATDYGENRTVSGLSDKGTIVEFWSSLRGSWTLILTLPDGQSCLIDSGQAVAFAPPGEPA